MSSIRSNKATLMWAFFAVIGIGLLLTPFARGVQLPVIVLQVVFALVHGARRYGWRAIVVFIVGGLLISNILENLSISTGFPFGDYHYTGSGKIFQVPWFIGPAYLATGYLAWVVATVLLGDIHRKASWLTTIGTPVVAAFTMTLWDLSFDPIASTIHQNWIWEDGGGFFGVPLGNFLGWTFTVYLFVQVFALYVHFRGQLPEASTDRGLGSALQGTILYGLTAVGFFFGYSTEDHTQVTDAIGNVWKTADIYETSALVTVYGMFFVTLLAVLRIAQQRAAAPALPTSVKATKPAKSDQVKTTA